MYNIEPLHVTGFVWDYNIPENYQAQIFYFGGSMMKKFRKLQGKAIKGFPGYEFKGEGLPFNLYNISGDRKKGVFSLVP